MEPAMTVQNLYVSYHGNEVIQNVSFSIEPGSLVGIIGPNGAGKSTMLKAILGLIPKDSGEVAFLGKAVNHMRKKIAYVPQRNDIDWDFPITVIQTVLLGTYPHLGLFRRPNKKDRKWAWECLEKVGMKDYGKKQIGELSGGQQQRVFIARALAQKADIFFLDEPFVGIDVASEEVIIHILKELRDDGKIVMVVHHDLSKAHRYFDELLLLNKELIGCGPVEQVIQPELISKAYKAHFSMLEEMGVSV